MNRRIPALALAVLGLAAHGTAGAADPLDGIATAPVYNGHPFHPDRPEPAP